MRMRFFDMIIGAPGDFPIEHRFLNGSCAIATVLALLVAANNLVLGLDPFLNGIILFGFLYFCMLYFFARIRGAYHFPLWGFVILCCLSLPPAWFLNGGIFGSTLFICIVIMALMLIMVRGRMRLIAAMFFAAELVTMIIIEYHRPDLVVPYRDRYTQFVDILINLVLSLVVLCAIVTLVMKNYGEEKLKADESNRLKSYFLANISHEIRTPMNSILGFSELLKERTITDMERGHYIETIIKNGRHLLVLINDIIDLSRIEAGEVVIKIRPCSLDSIMEELYDIFSMHVKTANRGVEIRIVPEDTGRSPIVRTDELRVRQVLMNLLSNAVKFTETGSIEFGYSFDDEARVSFFVKDTGVGIRPEHRDYVFHQFKQADDTHTREYGGAGLGLSISRKLINVMGGDIRFESEPGRGTTFCFDIPCQGATAEEYMDEQEKRAVRNVESKRSDWEGRTVLVVEDNDDSFRLLERLLSKYGIRVLRASNGKEAVECARSEAVIDCVLMDIQLPVMNGYDAVRAIRALGKTYPIVAQSGNAFDTDRNASLDAGCNEFMAKPIIPEKLLKILEKYL